jgi:UDP-3-O-[3-hydroxymyristoyl] N-acetylglucosamine deacetylase
VKQTTLAKAVSGVGIGLHKGEPISIRLEPLEANSGILFYRSDVGLLVQALPQNVVNTQMATVIGNSSAYISTIEHLLSAVYAYGIDNIRVVLDGAEVPVMDGSSASFCMMLDEAGTRKLEATKQVLIIKKEVEVQDGKKFARVTPSLKPSYSFMIEFNHPSIGRQEYSFEFSKKNFIEEISRARTFGFLKDVQMLRSRGLALGGSLDNAVAQNVGGVCEVVALQLTDPFHCVIDNQTATVDRCSQRTRHHVRVEVVGKVFGDGARHTAASVGFRILDAGQHTRGHGY